MRHFAPWIIAIALASGLSWYTQSFAFDIPTDDAEVGEPVLLQNVNIERFYGVFLPEDVGLGGDQCALISGVDLALDNNLRHYGTCFVNDSGTFAIIELSEAYSANYDDTLRAPAFMGQHTLTLHEPGIE